MDTIPEVSDERLFIAYRDGDLRAFETLFERYQGPLGRHLERMVRDRAAAEDIVIETFLRLHRHRQRFRTDASVRAWVYTIARNLARNRLRRDRLRAWLPLAAVDQPGSGVAPTPPPAAGGDEIQRRVGAAFALLPARQREVCSLRLLGELSLEEIALVTGTSIGTVKSRLFYGQRRLRDLLADLVG